MKKLGIAGIVGIISVLMFAMFTFGNFHTVKPGEVGIIVDQMGGDKGIANAKILSDGWTFTGPTEKMIKYYTRVEIKRYTADKRDDSPVNQRFTFTSKEGMKIGSDMTLRYRVDPSKVNLIYARYKKNVRDMAESDIWNTIGDLLVKHSTTMKIEDWIAGGKIGMLASVESDLREAYLPYGIIIEKLAWFGDPELPGKVVDAINVRIQRQNEVATVKAEADKKIEKTRGETESQRMKADADAYEVEVAAAAEAKRIKDVSVEQAEANKRLARSVTPALTDYLKAEKWDGVLPKYTGAANTLLSVN